MSKVKSIEFECDTCEVVNRTATVIKAEEWDDGACGDPYCCGYPSEWVVLKLLCPVCNKETTVDTRDFLY